jgi:hypothetical protein
MSQLTSVFSRLRVQSLIFGKQLAPSVTDTVDEHEISPIVFRTMNEARDENFKIINAAVGLVATTTMARYTNAVTVEHIAEQKRLEVRLQQWRMALEKFLQHEGSTLDFMDTKSVQILKAQNLTSYIWLATCLSPEECQYDNYTKEFEEVVKLAGMAIDIPLEYLCDSVGRFQFDIGLLPVLHMVGSKCRWPHIRRETMRILAAHRWREGLFDSYRSYRYIRAVMEVEDAGKRHVLGLKPSELDDFVVPEVARVHFADM